MKLCAQQAFRALYTDTVYVLVMVEQVVGEVMEERGVFGREEAVVDLVYGFLELSVCLVIFARDVPAYT